MVKLHGLWVDGVVNMSMHTHVSGFKPPDEKWQAYKLIWDTCKAQKVEVPKEVGDFFDWTSPNDHGMMVDISGAMVEGIPDHDMQECFDIDITKLPKDVTVIRFSNNY